MTDIRRFFGGGGIHYTRPNSESRLQNVQQRIAHIYTNGHLMDPEQLERAMDGVLGATREMVRSRAAERAARESQVQRKPTLAKVEAITREQFDQICEHDCGICFETHNKGKTLNTSCGHVYCLQCWHTWMSTPNSNRTCPTCRANLPSYTYYKVKSSRENIETETTQA